MEKTQEQNKLRRQEIIDNFIEQLKSEYKNFSAVISVNDGEGASCLVYGSTLNLACNVKIIEDNEAYQKTKKIIKSLDLITED